MLLTKQQSPPFKNCVALNKNSSNNLFPNIFHRTFFTWKLNIFFVTPVNMINLKYEMAALVSRFQRLIEPP